MASPERHGHRQTEAIPRYRGRTLQRLSDGSAVLIAFIRFALSATLIGCGAMHAASSHAAKLQGAIATADTSIVVEAGEHVPRLLTLALRGAAAWNNTRAEPLPEQVKINDAALTVTWRLDRSASRFKPNDIQIVYVADSPRLKAVWRWRARADFGPIEHSVSIQNLGDETVWLRA